MIADANMAEMFQSAPVISDGRSSRDSVNTLDTKVSIRARHF